MEKIKVYFNDKELRNNIGQKLKKLFPSYFKRFKTDLKYSSIEKEDIAERIEKLRNILKIDEKLECKTISNRVILIKKS